MNRLRKYLAEAVGTFCLVFAGTSSIVVNNLSNGAITHLGICLVFGLVVLAMVYTIGPISGAHMNPAVTIGFWSIGRIGKSEIIPYVGSQIGGALLGSILVACLFGRTTTHLGATLPTGPWQQSLLMEFVLTFILMLVIIGVAHEDRAEGLMAGVVIGSVIVFDALIGGPISGGSMNPARSFAPALLSGTLNFQWIYWIGPILGSLTGAFVSRFIYG